MPQTSEPTARQKLVARSGSVAEAVQVSLRINGKASKKTAEPKGLNCLMTPRKPSGNIPKTRCSIGLAWIYATLLSL
jgi:hypothetical protein